MEQTEMKSSYQTGEVNTARAQNFESRMNVATVHYEGV